MHFFEKNPLQHTYYFDEKLNIAWYPFFPLLRLDSLFRVWTAAPQARGAVVQRKDQVIQLLQGMAEKGKKEKHEEQVLPFPHPLHNFTNLYWACHGFLTSSRLHPRISSGCVLSNRQQAFPPRCSSLPTSSSAMTRPSRSSAPSRR